MTSLAASRRPQLEKDADKVESGKSRLIQLDAADFGDGHVFGGGAALTR